MVKKTRASIFDAILILVLALPMQQLLGQATDNGDDPNAKPPVTQADVRIVQRAREILSSSSKWNRADTRVCPADAETFSIYCSLEKATQEVTGKFKHRGAAMQEARFVVEEVAPGKNYEHRLMGYNNDPATKFADVERFFVRLEARVTARLREHK